MCQHTTASPGMKYAIYTNIIACLFILLFSYAAVSKILDYENFHLELSSFPYLPDAIKYFAWLVPLSEFVIILFLILPRYRLAGFYTAILLLIIFTVYLFMVLLFAPHIPCSCGGILQKLSWKAHIIFNSCWILLGVTGMWLEKKHLKNEF